MKLSRLGWLVASFLLLVMGVLLLGGGAAALDTASGWFCLWLCPLPWALGLLCFLRSKGRLEVRS